MPDFNPSALEGKTSKRVKIQLEALEIIYDSYQKNPWTPISGLRNVAEHEIVDRYWYDSYTTPQAHLVRKDTPYQISTHELDRLIGEWLAEDSEALRDYYYRDVRAYDKRSIIEFFKRYTTEDFALPEEIVEVDETLHEGARRQIWIDAYERKPEARRKCIAYHGATCRVCGFDFAETYGEIGRGLIHVHHLTPLSEVDGTYEVDPRHDLIPVCPNCHAIIHKRKPTFTIEEVKAFLRQAKQGDAVTDPP